MAKTNPFASEMVRMQFPQNSGGTINIGGYLLEADEDNCVELPKKLVPDAQSHGLTVFEGRPKPNIPQPQGRRV